MCECILLDPDKGSATIKERLSDLKERDETYTEQQLLQHIDSTKGILRHLKTVCAKRIELWKTGNHPVFRMLILDDCLFVSTYTKGHGHESPVYQITKDSKKSDGSSWFESFVKFYENIKICSEKCSLN